MKAVKRVGNAIGKAVGKIPVVGKIAKGVSNAAKKVLKNPLVRMVAVAVGAMFLGPAVGSLLGSAGSALGGTVGGWLSSAGNFLSASGAAAGAANTAAGGGLTGALSTAAQAGWSNVTSLGGLIGGAKEGATAGAQAAGKAVDVAGSSSSYLLNPSTGTPLVPGATEAVAGAPGASSWFGKDGFMRSQGGAALIQGAGRMVEGYGQGQMIKSQQNREDQLTREELERRRQNLNVGGLRVAY